jgi:hypothetical protein
MKAMFASEEIPESLETAGEALRRIGKSAAELAWPLLAGVGGGGAGIDAVQALKAAAGLRGDELERLLVWHAARGAEPLVGSLPLEQSVLDLLKQDLPQLHAERASLVAGSSHFNRAAKIATLRRFPAGPMEWEVSGIPRSWIVEAGVWRGSRLLWFVLTRLGGLAPCFFMHVAPAPRTRALVLEKEVLRSYYRMVRSLEMRQDMRALLACAWFHDPAAVRDSPHLAALSRPYLENGGIIVPLRPAKPDSGVLERNARRRADFEAGRIVYRETLAIWPRDAAVAWANGPGREAAER